MMKIWRFGVLLQLFSSRSIRLGFITIALFLIFSFFTYIFLFGVETRFLFVSSQSGAVHLTVGGTKALQIQLPEAEVTFADDIAADANLNANKNAPAELLFSVYPGAEIRLQRYLSSSDLAIMIKRVPKTGDVLLGQRTLKEDDEIVIRNESLLELDEIVSQGNISIGASRHNSIMSSLVEAEYSYYERNHFQESFTLVKSGNLMRAEGYSLHDEYPDCIPSIKYMIEVSPRTNGIFAHVSSLNCLPYFKLHLFDDDNRLTIAPSWLDRAINDRYFIAIAAVLGFLLLVGELALIVKSLSGRSNFRG